MTESEMNPPALDASSIESNDVPPASPDEGFVIEEQPSRLKKFLKTLGWTGLTVFFLVLFTILKLPEDRLKNFIQGSIASALSSQQIGFTAGEGHLSIFFGASYVMKDVRLTFPPPATPVHLEQIKVAPSLFKMLTGRMGGKIWIQPGKKESDGSLFAEYSMRNNSMSLAYDLNSIDLGKLGLLAMAADIKGSAVASGKGQLEGDLSNLASLSGQIGLNLAKVRLDAQTIQFFSIPPINVSEGKIDLDIGGGKANIKTFQLGKSASDDIRARLTGSVNLGRSIHQSNLNVKAEFSLSESILKAFVILDGLLSPGKQADGSYAFNLTGPVTSVQPDPVSGVAK